MRPLLKATGAAALVMAILLLGGAGYIGGTRFFAHVRAAVASPQEPPRANSAERFRVGAIRFVPWTGVETCEQRRFDNMTGEILWDGTVACTFQRPSENTDMVLRPSDEPVVDVQARMRAIHKSFTR